MNKSKLTAMALAMSPGLLFGSPARAQAAADSAQVEHDSVVGPAFHVSDLGKSIKFYREGLGMQVTMQFGADGAPLDVRQRTANGQLALGFANTVMSFGTGPTDPLIMLLPEKAGSAQKIAQAYGYARTAFRLTDLPAIARRLRAAGYQPGEIRGAHGTHQVMLVTDPDGYVVELVERSIPNHSN